MNRETLRKIERRHVEQANYRGRQEPTKANHKTGYVPVCASCHQIWPCDASVAVRAALHPESPPKRLLDAARSGATPPPAGLREALAEAIEGGWEPSSIHPGLYHNDPVFHAVVYTVQHSRLAAATPPAAPDVKTLREALANLPPPDLGVPPSSDRTWLAGMQYGATVAWRATRADAAALAEPESDTRETLRNVTTDQLVDIIEQAIFETGTGLEAALLAADRIRAALAEPESDTLGGLDPDTLARAMATTIYKGSRDSYAALADRVAAEYARLRSSTATAAESDVTDRHG